MKCLFFLPLTFLLLLASTVSSQNPNMFEFTVHCHNKCQACDATDLLNQAGQIISNNLILTSKIKVDVTVGQLLNQNSLGGGFPQTSTNTDPEDKVSRLYPTALLRQLDPNFKSDDPDIFMDINSSLDSSFWFKGISTGEIQPDQYDFLEFVLHELHHGLGIDTSWSISKDDDIGIGLIPELEYSDDPSGKVVFKAFYETLFDKFLVSLRGGDLMKDYTKTLNDMAGPDGKVYNDLDDFFTQLRDKQNQAGKTYTENMLDIATTKNRLGFLITTDDASVNDDGGEAASEAILLESNYNPFVDEKSITHLSYNVYYDTEDFLFVAEQTKGLTLDGNFETYGEYPGGGVGPSLFTMLESLGYKQRLPVRRRKPPTTFKIEKAS